MNIRTKETDVHKVFTEKSTANKTYLIVLCLWNNCKYLSGLNLNYAFIVYILYLIEHSVINGTHIDILYLGFRYVS